MLLREVELFNMGVAAGPLTTPSDVNWDAEAVLEASEALLVSLEVGSVVEDSEAFSEDESEVGRSASLEGVVALDGGAVVASGCGFGLGLGLGEGSSRRRIAWRSARVWCRFVARMKTVTRLYSHEDRIFNRNVWLFSTKYSLLQTCIFFFSHDELAYRS